jgi:sterol O-acyltransferase
MTPPGSHTESMTGASTPDSQSSIEDYDDIAQASDSHLARHRQRRFRVGLAQGPSEDTSKDSGVSREHSRGVLAPLQTEKDAQAFVLRADNDEIREVLQRGLQRARDPSGKSRTRAKFSDLVFTRKFSAFDRQNEDAANSPFHGFFTLFWMAMFIFVLKIGAENWRKWGNPLGTNEIIQGMVRRDLIVLLLADGVMCALTGVSWVLQRLVFAGYLDWGRSGLVIQNVSSHMAMPYMSGVYLLLGQMN